MTLRSFFRRIAIVPLVVVGIALLFASPAEAAEKRMKLAHNVFFSLKDVSPAAQERLVAACHRYLKNQQGVVFFAAGTLAQEFAREVNDRDFQVGLHVVFASKADHDRYQDHPEHLKFIEEQKENWAKVRVFDSYVE
ncbi:MAG: Dabb family protein [Bryobacterales bacterium]|nr:Dabb family protein [Bryobacterales bacterium]